METQKDLQNGKTNPNSNYLCRQSSTRWTPTTDQLKLLKDLYYINGLRSPSSDQIQSICDKLRRYGKIEGKNVFYWFQNHKARERQKKRSSTPISNIKTRTGTGIGGHHWKQDQEFSVSNVQTTKCYNPSCTPPGRVGSSSSSYGTHGALTMENKFRDCSVLAGNYNPNFLDYNHDRDGAPQRETLPLFPMHNDQDHDYQFGSVKSLRSDGCCWASGGGNRSAASLELSLYSYGYGSCYSQN